MDSSSKGLYLLGPINMLNTECQNWALGAARSPNKKTLSDRATANKQCISRCLRREAVYMSRRRLPPFSKTSSRWTALQGSWTRYARQTLRRLEQGGRAVRRARGCMHLDNSRLWFQRATIRAQCPAAIVGVPPAEPPSAAPSPSPSSWCRNSCRMTSCTMHWHES